MKTKVSFLAAILLGLGCLTGNAQGFINLNFERAKIVTDPSYPYYAYASNAVPGWTAYLDGIPQSNIFYNEVSFGAAEVSIHDSNGTEGFEGFLPLAGRYSVLLQGTFGSGMPGEPSTAAIGQTGMIPIDMQSLIFWGALVSGLQVTFDGQPIAFEAIGNGANYTIYGADISAFAGQAGELLFSTSNNGWAMLDNIQFSSNPVPEPGTWSLLALGGAAFVFVRRKCWLA